MQVKELVDLLNEDLRNEYKHHLFYLHSFNVLIGLERLYLGPWLKSQAEEEAVHVQEFAKKIVAFGAMPVSGLQSHPFPSLRSADSILGYALEMEKEVVANYHVRHAQATEVYETTHQHYDLVVFLEDQIEHSQGDIDEILRMLGEVR
jgi:ferritin